MFFFKRKVLFITTCSIFLCASTATASSCVDSDGDGWGWDGTQSCIVKSESQNESAPIASNCSDPDGDGWGWYEGKSCKVGLKQKNITKKTSAHSNFCQNSESDPDGDGFGWENNRSCVVKKATQIWNKEDGTIENPFPIGTHPRCLDWNNDGKYTINLGGTEFGCNLSQQAKCSYSKQKSANLMNVAGKYYFCKSEVVVKGGHGVTIINGQPFAIKGPFMLTTTKPFLGASSSFSMASALLFIDFTQSPPEKSYISLAEYDSRSKNNQEKLQFVQDYCSNNCGDILAQVFEGQNFGKAIHPTSRMLNSREEVLESLLPSQEPNVRLTKELNFRDIVWGIVDLGLMAASSKANLHKPSQYIAKFGKAVRDHEKNKSRYDPADTNMDGEVSGVESAIAGNFATPESAHLGEFGGLDHTYSGVESGGFAESGETDSGGYAESSGYW